MQDYLSVRELTSLDEFRSVSNEWNNLVHRSQSSCLFLTYEWLSSWWGVFKEQGIQLFILLVYRQEDLVGGVPYIIYRQRQGRFFKRRSLYFLGTGEPEWEEVDPEYLDIIAEPDDKTVVPRALCEYLCGKDNWDEIVMLNVLASSITNTHLAPAFDAVGCHACRIDKGLSYRIKLPATWEAYLDSLSANMKKNMLRFRRRIGREGDAEYQLVTKAVQIEPALDNLIRLHRIRWQNRQVDGAFRSIRFIEFHRRFMETALRMGQLRLYQLILNGNPIGAMYNYRNKTTEYYYQSGIDTDSAKQLKPGMLLHGFAIESAITDGMGYYDFMRGAVDSYKNGYGCEKDTMYDIKIYARTLRGRALSFFSRRLRSYSC